MISNRNLSKVSSIVVVVLVVLVPVTSINIVEPTLQCSV